LREFSRRIRDVIPGDIYSSEPRCNLGVDILTLCPAINHGDVGYLTRFEKVVGDDITDSDKHWLSVVIERTVTSGDILDIVVLVVESVFVSVVVSGGR
jgi:hypothetical protein